MIIYQPDQREKERSFSSPFFPSFLIVIITLTLGMTILLFSSPAREAHLSFSLTSLALAGIGCIVLCGICFQIMTMRFQRSLVQSQQQGTLPAHQQEELLALYLTGLRQLNLRQKKSKRLIQAWTHYAFQYLSVSRKQAIVDLLVGRSLLAELDLREANLYGLNLPLFSSSSSFQGIQPTVEKKTQERGYETEMRESQTEGLEDLALHVFS